jgi:hypothetical protein
MLIASLQSSTLVVLLLILTQLIMLYALIHMVIISKDLYVAYTKTTKADGQEFATVYGGVELCTYETLKGETSIHSLSHLARYADNTEYPDG